MIDLNGIEITTMIRDYDLDTYIIVSGFPKYKNDLIDYMYLII